MNKKNDNYTDLKSWVPGYTKHLEYIQSKDPNKKSLRIPKADVDSLRVYALINSVLSTKPNGIHRSVASSYPMNDLVWWDFDIECPRGWIHIERTSTALNISYGVDGPFDAIKFIKNNILRYSKSIDKKIKSYELIKRYVNHYRSYIDTIKMLHDEIQSLDLSEPRADMYAKAEKDGYNYKEDLNRFSKNSVKLQIYGKSLVLNCAFASESFMGLLILFGSESALNEQKVLLDMHINSSFKNKLKNSHILSSALSSAVDIDHPAVQQILALMTKRNKYVHSDLSGITNYVDDIYFDDLYPLHNTNMNFRDPLTEHIKSIYHNPGIGELIKNYESTLEFIDYIKSLHKKEYVEYFEVFIDQANISFNTTTFKYPIIDLNTFADVVLSDSD